MSKEKAIRWFENIADECDKLTSGNVAHLRVQIKGMAIRSVEYLTKHSQEPASEDFESEWKRYCDSKGGGAVTMNVKDVAKHFAQWQRERDQKELQIAEEHGILTGMNMEREKMMKDAVEAVVSQVPCSNEIIFRNPASVSYWYLPSEMNRLGINKGDKVNLIIIKE